MKKKILIASIIGIIVLTGAATVAATTNFESIFSMVNIGTSQYLPPSERVHVVSNQEEVLTYIQSTEISLTEQYTPVGQLTAVAQRHTYTAENGNLYIYDEDGRLQGYMNLVRDPIYQADPYDEEGCAAVLRQFLVDNDLDPTPYTQAGMTNDMQYQLAVPGNKYQVDTITATFSDTGILVGVVLNCNKIESISTSDIQYFEEEMESYLINNGYTDTITDTHVSYRRIENTLVAYYHITFQQSDGSVYIESFAIGRDKLLW